ncbi:response regulator [Desertivirga xinjiangensis]|uniref:response regulator n=1 Tax=Desertivirga xinjiangensis TaxID=539206 RepID=UPI00210E1CC0|nr:response regulator [Pedobacter xinjiangensis]
MKQILLIDDDSRNIFALKAVLKAKGFSCLTATAASDGLSLLFSNTNNIGIILMDMMMPDMDGYEAIAEVRKNKEFQSLPIVAVTAQAMVGDKEKCLDAGANAYISKPINVDLLMEILKEHL